LARGRAAVKASGGIASLEQAIELVEAGASRLGTSRGVALIRAGKSFGQRPESAPPSGNDDQEQARGY
jgi:deoxyribose-phosphate aldolase